MRRGCLPVAAHNPARLHPALRESARSVWGPCGAQGSAPVTGSVSAHDHTQPVGAGGCGKSPPTALAPAHRAPLRRTVWTVGRAVGSVPLCADNCSLSQTFPCALVLRL